MIPEMTIVAMTLFAECAGEPLEGKMAVMSAIANRASQKKSLRDVCLSPYQFSCWNGHRGKHSMLKKYYAGKFTGSAWEDCKRVVEMWADGTLPKTKYTHYYNPKLCKPTWAGKMKNTKRIGRHLFGRID